MKQILIFIIIAILSACSAPVEEGRIETFDVYAIAVPFFTNDVQFTVEYDGSADSFSVEGYFIILKTESNVTIISPYDAHYHGDETIYTVHFNYYLNGYDNTNLLPFIFLGTSYNQTYVFNGPKYESDWFVKPVDNLSWMGSNINVYKLATLEEFNQNSTNPDVSASNFISYRGIEINVSTQWMYTNDITTNCYVIEFRKTPELIWYMTNDNITVDSNTFTLMNALEDKYYPQRGKLYLTLNGWPDWPW